MYASFIILSYPILSLKKKNKKIYIIRKDMEEDEKTQNEKTQNLIGKIFIGIILSLIGIALAFRLYMCATGEGCFVSK